MTRLIRFAELGSTSDTLKMLAKEGAADGTWVMADAQTAGRGRQGRVWQSPGGNLYCSTLVRTNHPAPAQLSFVAALAAQHMVGEYLPGVQIKWPNDILWAGKKLSGILLESELAPNGDCCLVIGFGINLAHAPEGLDRPVTSLQQETGATPTPACAQRALAVHFDCWRARWDASGFAAVRAAWLEAATGIGARINVQLGRDMLSGVFESIDHSGALCLRLDSGALRVLHAGEIFGI